MKIGKAIPRKIIIHPSENEGYIVANGCGHFVFANAKTMIKALEEYLDDPKKIETEYNNVIGPQPRPEPDPPSVENAIHGG